jgi:HEAT repeat protein
MKRIVVAAGLSLLLLVLASPPAMADTVAPAAGSPEEIARRTATIRYGIESELLDLFKTLVSEKEGRYDDEILALFKKTSSAKLKIAILDLYRQLAWKGGEDEALAVVKGRDNQDQNLVAGALDYLAELRSKRALEYSKTLLDENNKAYIVPLIRLLGRAGGPAEEEILLGWLKGDAPTQQQREAAIRALGDIGSDKAADSLMKIVEDPAAQRFERVYAAGSLAKIGRKSALASLIKAANGDDPTVQAAAIEAIGSFSGPEAETALVEGLRDSFPKSRIAACQALAKLRLASALPNLEYKASNDPEKTVKTEALKAIGEIGGKEAFAYIETVVADKKADAGLRVTGYGILARKNAAGSLASLSSLLLEEGKTVDRLFYTALVREIAGASDAPDITQLAKILLSDKDYLIRLGGLEWAKATLSPDIRTTLADLAAKDPNEAVRKKAAEILGRYK